MKSLKNKKYVVTCAWPYVNSVPHLGTFLHLICLDVYERYLKLRGADVISATGSDCHGTPIEVSALKEGISPQELVDRNHKIILSLLKKWNININYSMTANPYHIKFVQDFYRRCYNNGYIFEKETVQLYCEHDKKFLPDRYVEGICPYCHSPGARGDQCDSPECGKPLKPADLIDPKCKICGNTPVLKKSKQWYYNFTAFQDQILEYIKNNHNFPENARKFSLQILESEGLQPRALTRDLDWGIPIEPAIPEAKGKSIYVWLEAVLGYVSASAEYLEKKYHDPDLWKEYWLDQDTRTIFFIGKDNIFFHTILFPALLLGVEDSYGKPFVLPYNVSTTEFILFDKEKFSKSRGIGIWIDEAEKILPTDYWRYYLIATRPETRDSAFSWKDFEQKINSDLNDSIGNFIHRVLILIAKYFDQKVPEPREFDDIDRHFINKVKEVPEKYVASFDNFKFKEAVSHILEFVYKANTYLSDRQPWHTIKNDIDRTKTTLYLGIQAVRTLAILLAPIVPSSADKIWHYLALQGSVHEQDIQTASEFLIKPGHKIGKSVPLFFKVEATELETKLKEIKGENKMSDKKDNEEKIPFSDFKKLDIRVGKIVEAEAIPKANKLLKLQVDLGSEIGIRQLVAGIAPYRDIKELIGQKIIVIVNLQPAKIRGVESNGMLLAAIDGNKLGLLTTDIEVAEGSRIS